MKTSCKHGKDITRFTDGFRCHECGGFFPKSSPTYRSGEYLTDLWMALHNAAQFAKGEPATIYSDSQYALNCLKRAVGWKVRGWRKADGKEIANLDLVKALHAADLTHFRWTWVRGHNGNKWNEEADRLAEVTRGGGVECIHAVGVEYLPLSMTDKVLLETDERIGEHFRPFAFCPHCGTALR